jgi:glycosyltransferase involved in cell wall biosynthesis
MSKVILISQVPLPYSKIGSWTTLYTNYLRNKPQIDCIICEQPDVLFEGIQYEIVPNTLFLKVQKKLFRNPYLGYLRSLETAMNKFSSYKNEKAPDNYRDDNQVLNTFSKEKKIVDNEKYIIQIIDNFGIVKPLVAFLEKKGKRKQCYLQFFYHGFPPFYGNSQDRFFFKSIDEMVVLTHDSYLEHKKYYTVLPTRFSVLHNGIDTQTFFPLPKKEKRELQNSKGVANKKVFVWCSQDRPKKGLHILLDAWKSVYAVRQDIVLWVIGCEPKVPQDGVEYLGRIPNNELATFFQASDCYLFPTLWHEGFGLSLIEALHCGNYCIVSAIGGVPEVLQYGKLGKLIENPHFVSAWEEAILEFLDNPIPEITIPTDLYSAKSWNIGMNTIINNAKKTF